MNKSNNNTPLILQVKLLVLVQGKLQILHSFFFFGEWSISFTLCIKYWIVYFHTMDLGEVSFERHQYMVSALFFSLQIVTCMHVAVHVLHRVFLLLQLVSVIHFITWWNKYWTPDEERKQRHILFLQ